MRDGLLALVFSAIVLAGCHARGPNLNDHESSVLILSGTEIVHRFESGRIYRAAYGDDSVAFELLKPRLDPPPRKTVPYTAKRLRPALFLVVWNDPDFYTTFVLDFDERRLHASARRLSEGVFLGEAEIIEIGKPSSSGQKR